MQETPFLYASTVTSVANHSVCVCSALPKQTLWLAVDENAYENGTSKEITKLV